MPYQLEGDFQGILYPGNLISITRSPFTRLSDHTLYWARHLTERCGQNVGIAYMRSPMSGLADVVKGWFERHGAPKHGEVRVKMFEDDDPAYAVIDKDFEPCDVIIVHDVRWDPETWDFLRKDVLQSGKVVIAVSEARTAPVSGFTTEHADLVIRECCDDLAFSATLVVPKDDIGGDDIMTMQIGLDLYESWWK